MEALLKLVLLGSSHFRLITEVNLFFILQELREEGEKVHFYA